MNENEVIKRLGLKNSSELADLLGFDIVFCEENTYFKLGEKSNRGNANKNVLKRGWRVVLKGKNRGEAIERGKCKNPSNFPKGNVPKGEGKDWYFHRGHILGYTFHKYLSGYKYVPIVGENRSWTIEDINDPERNLTTQFSYANEIQGIIEREIEKYLSANKDLTLEVKVVYKGGYDVYPIGTEIFYEVLTDHTSQNYQYGHYFISNTDVGFEIPDTAEETYHDFYANGYKERYRQYFVDSVRRTDDYQFDEDYIGTVYGEGPNFSLPKVSKKVFNKVKDKFSLTDEGSRDINNCGKGWEIDGITLTYFDSETLRLQGKNRQQLLEIVEKIVALIGK
ncbi:hypothetical protein F6P74_01715 [Streptococcus suis]|uniref:hypothetical protein n=1 Tax=Streptococcus suis TaxID=1307 RepID=UPI000CF494C7|nr:hypothetical protein [Streptococcus suis]MBS8070276.1 hypothetical protein [Streptococcus suis]MBS8094196.1 hypothetical protein [Streptococcus suis]MBS8102234.1 hypothetical protein [Streptococcus suis]MBY4977429.1 hypothetical protein [Streptococcus suis]